MGRGRTDDLVSLSSGVEIEMLGGPGKLIEGIEGASEMLILGGSGTLIVGIIGAEAVDSGSEGFIPRRDIARLLPPSRLARRRLDGSCFESGCRDLQSWSKLTMGLPGRSLTAVGVGNFGLRSFNDLLVAARISSPRISISFVVDDFLPRSFPSIELEESGGVGDGKFWT